MFADIDQYFLNEQIIKFCEIVEFGSDAAARKTCRSQKCCIMNLFLQEIGFDTAQNEPSQVMFSYFLIPKHLPVLKSKYDVVGFLFNGLVLERRPNSDERHSTARPTLSLQC
jgi:hypothetical protein